MLTEVGITVNAFVKICLKSYSLHTTIFHTILTLHTNSSNCKLTVEIWTLKNTLALQKQQM